MEKHLFTANTIFCGNETWKNNCTIYNLILQGHYSILTKSWDKVTL